MYCVVKPPLKVKCKACIMLLTGVNRDPWLWTKTLQRSCNFNLIVEKGKFCGNLEVLAGRKIAQERGKTQQEFLSLYCGSNCGLLGSPDLYKSAERVTRRSGLSVGRLK